MELQDLDPQAVLLSAEAIGNLGSVSMPFNVQNLLGNWLMLLGQIIITYNAQQQLWENGPGVVYSCSRKSNSSSLGGLHQNHDALLDRLQSLEQEVAYLQQALVAQQENNKKTIL